MGKEYVAVFPDGSYRDVARFSSGRAKLFFDICVVLENYVRIPCGVEDDKGEDEHEVNAEQFVKFFDRILNEGWLIDKASFVSGWVPWAIGIVENITLKPIQVIDRHGRSIQSERYRLDEEALELELEQQRKDNLRVIQVSGSTNFTL